MVSTWLGDAPRIENTRSTSWKPLRSSSGHALDDDDDDDDDICMPCRHDTFSELILSRHKSKIIDDVFMWVLIVFLNKTD